MMVLYPGEAPPPAGSNSGGVAPPPGVAAPTASTGYLAGVMAAGRTSTGSTAPTVFLGETHTTGRPGGMGVSAFGTKVDQTREIGAMSLDFEAMSFRDQQEMARKLILAGYLSLNMSESPAERLKRATLDEIEAAYETMLLDAAGRYASGQRITPDALLDMHIDFNLRNAGIDDAKDPWKAANRKTKTKEEPGYTGTDVQRDVTRDIWNASEARSLARATLQNALGRDPTKAEYEDFVAALQEQQRENPVRTRTSTTYEDGVVTNTSRTSRGGVDPQQFAYEQAQENPGYAEWNAVGTYLPVAMNALASGVPGA